MTAIIFALLLSLLLGLSLGGCSAVRIGYGNAPSLLYWWIDGYVDFDETQSVKARAVLGALHTWHAQQELPTYIGLLQSWQTMAPSDVTPQQVCGQMEAVRNRLRALLANAEPGMAALAPTVKLSQIEHIRKQFDKRNQKWREEWLDGSLQERRARRAKQATERYESFYGTLDEPQLAVIRANLERSRFDPHARYQETQQRQHEALQALRQLLVSGKSETGAAAAVHAVIEHTLSSPDAAMRTRFETDFQDNCRAMALVHNSTTAAQRRKAITTLKSYQDDLRAVLPAAR